MTLASFLDVANLVYSQRRPHPSPSAPFAILLQFEVRLSSNRSRDRNLVTVTRSASVALRLANVPFIHAIGSDTLFLYYHSQHNGNG